MQNYLVLLKKTQAQQQNLGTKGKIEITNTWTGSSKFKTKNKHNVINFCNVKDIYILNQKISDKLINNKVNQNFDNMILNMEIIDKWLN